jgi:hypothetical protein
MGFILKNTSGLINTRLTDTGRRNLSKGNFNISYFQVGDSEVSYTLAGTSYNQFDTNILVPNFNSQNSAGIPQSNKQYVKYPYYVDGNNGNTYGIPFLDSVVQPVYNRAAMRGFFTGNTTADTINWSAFTNNQYAINSNYVVDMSTLTGSNVIGWTYSGCNDNIVRLPMIGDIITIFFDGSGKTNCDCSYSPTPTPTPSSSPIPIDYQIYYVTDCCGEKPDGYMSLPNTYNSWDIVGATNNTCYTVNYPLDGTPTLFWNNTYYGNGDCTSCNSIYPCGVTPTPTPTSGFNCFPPVTPTPSSTFCVTQEPYYCPPPKPANCEMAVTSCYTILTYKIVDICGKTFTLDRPTPDFSMFSDCCYARTIIYPPNMNTIYDSVTPMPHWKEDVIDFESVCDRDQFDVKVWNMNIPWSENPAGLFTNINLGYLNYNSVSYIGTKEYYGYMSDSGQTDSSLVFYYNSFGDIIKVEPKDQKAIAIIHYTNNSIDFFYGEKFALEPYDISNPEDTTGEARNFRLHIPTLMWHKNPECCFGQTFYVDPPGFDVKLGLFVPHYLTSNENSDMNNPVGLRYYHLWDTNPNPNPGPNFGKPNRIGKVFPDDQIIVIDDEEIIAAMSYKSNRNWTLPAPKIGLITPNTCGTNGETTIGLLTASTEYLYVTYRFTSDNTFTNSLHCNYYTKIQGPDLSCNPTSKQNVSIRFGSEFPCLNQPNFSIGTICVKILNECGPHSECPNYYDAVPSGEINGKNSYSVAGFEIFWNSELNRWESWLSDEPWGYLDNTGEYPIGVWSTVNPGIYPIFYETNLGECNISCNLTSGFFGEKFEIICQKVSGDTRPESSEWKIIDVTSQISGDSINGYITQSGITGNTFVISETDYEDAPYYNLGNDVVNPTIDIYGLSIPLSGQTGTTLNFGDEYYFYGSLETDIQATIYEMRYKINLGQAEFQSSSNPSWVDTTPSYISEIGLYDSDMNLMIVSKLQSPVLRQGIQQFLVKFDF